MALFDEGNGPPLIVIPGLQGRWEWTRPALAHLAHRCRTISYSLCGDLGSPHRLDTALGFENYVRQLDAVLDAAGLERAAICGVSFGGFVAVRYAALRPERVSALVLVSAPAPGWQPNPQQARWLSRPWLSAPVFVLTSPTRVWPEVSAALPSLSARVRFFVSQGLRCAAAPMIPGLMASRIRCAESVDFRSDCRRIGAATLVITGEERLDRIVPVRSTRSYASLIRGAEYCMLPQTGHMGLLTQPQVFARTVSDFVHAHHQ
jgi:pimeloyl-ACP methyl ester carboxylesterase